MKVLQVWNHMRVINENFPFFGELSICKNINTFTVTFDQVNAILAEWKY